MSVYLLKTPNKNHPSLRAEYGEIENATNRAEKSILSSLSKYSTSSKSTGKGTSPYTKVQTLSFQIYTGGAPAFIVDETTGKEKKNPECHDCKYNIF